MNNATFFRLKLSRLAIPGCQPARIRRVEGTRRNRLHSVSLLVLAGVACLPVAAQTGEWAWLSGSRTLGLNGVRHGIYGTFGIPNAANVPGGRFGGVSWIDRDGNFWLFGGFGSDSEGTNSYLNDLWKFDRSTREWTWMSGSSKAAQVKCQTGMPGCGLPGKYGKLGTPDAGNSPGGRWIAASWTDHLGNLWLFGGIGFDSLGYPGLMNDLWEFSPSTREWTWVAGSNTGDTENLQSGDYGMLGVAAPTNVPGPRWDLSTWVDRNNHLWLFGGFGADSIKETGLLNDIWEFNPSSREWTWMGGDTVVWNSLTKIGSASFYTGSPGKYGSLGIAASTNLPGSREGASGWVDSDGNLWLFGGRGNDATNDKEGELNDLWKFEPAKREWAWMGGSSTLICGGASDNCSRPGVYGKLGIPAATNIPAGRDGAAAWTDPDGNFWLMGGSGYNFAGRTLDYDLAYNDLWRFAPSTLEWTWVGGTSLNETGCTSTPGEGEFCGQPGEYGLMGIFAPNNVPGGRSGAAASTEAEGNVLFFGGAGFDSLDYEGSLNDLWEFEPAENLRFAAKPTIDKASGSYQGPITITISDTTPGTTIYYTTNDTAPTTRSIRYTGAIKLTRTTTVKGIAVADGYGISDVATATYKIVKGPTP